MGKTVKVDTINFQRLQLTKGNKSMKAKLQQILNLYYKEKGGELESLNLDKRTKSFNKLI